MRVLAAETFELKQPAAAHSANQFVTPRGRSVFAIQASRYNLATGPTSGALGAVGYTPDIAWLKGERTARGPRETTSDEISPSAHQNASFYFRAVD